MVRYRFFYFIKLVLIFNKTVFLHIMTSCNNPLKVIPIDLVFLVIPIFMSFFKIFPYLLHSPVLPWSVFILLLEKVLIPFFDGKFPSYIFQQHLNFIFVIIKFRKGNVNFLKHLMHILTINCCLTQITSFELFNPTLNEVKC